jgi:hypothetical protein
MLRKGILATLLALASVQAGLGADMASLAGTWKGPWYIGMSSGQATMQVAADGSGSIALTNMDEFGAAPVTIAKPEFDGKVFRFTAAGANGTALVIGLNAEADGRRLRGNGKYGGFGARVELQRVD